MDYMTLLGPNGNELHLPVEAESQLYRRAVEVLQTMTTKVHVFLCWERAAPACQSLCEFLSEALPYISSVSCRMKQDQSSETLQTEQKTLFLDLCLKAALQTGENSLNVVKMLLSEETGSDNRLDFYQHVKNKGFSNVIPKLRPLFQSGPAVWSINLSETKTSILLEVLKLQSEKKHVKLRGCSHEESEVRSFLQCLPYISQLSFHPWRTDQGAKFLGNLFCAAAEREQQTGEKMVELLSSLCSHDTFPLSMDDDDDDKEHQCHFLLDLCSHVKDYETKTGLSVLPSFQSVFQSGPPVWFIDLPKTKTSILLEVLKLQSEKKHVKLRVWPHEESEVRSFLQCLPYISQLSFHPWRTDEKVKFLGNLFYAAAERDQQTGEKMVELLSSLCSHDTFPLSINDGNYEEYRCHFLLDLCSHVKACETKTGLSVLPSFQSVFQSGPPVWSIGLSERKTSILLEVLKLQSEKKPMKLISWSHEESEVRSFLQCLPYISQLSFYPWWSDGGAKFLGNLFCAAAEREQQTGEKMVELLSSLCSHDTFPLYEDFLDDDVDDDDDDVDDDDDNDHYKEHRCHFLLDLCSHVKDYETKTGLSVLPSFQSVFQSGPPVWFIDLPKTKTSILLEVLKLQSDKKPMKLRVWPHEESEVRSFLQCLPYISQLSCDPAFFQTVCTSICVSSTEEAQQLVSLLQLLGFSLLLSGKIQKKTCRCVGRVLQLCGSKVDLTIRTSRMSVRGASLLFTQTTQLHSLRLSSNVALLLFQWVRRGTVDGPSAVEELCLVSERVQPSQRALLKVVSSLAFLLRHLSVKRLDLTESCIPAECLITLLLHSGPLTIKLSEETFQQLLVLLYEIQDRDLTVSFLNKVGGDLSCCCLTWELLHHLLQQSSAQTITVNLRKNHVLQESATRLLPFLDRIIFQRPSPSFVMTVIRELYRAHAGLSVPSLLRSFDHVFNLTCRELDSVDCAALLFVLKHSDRVQLNLLWTSIPAEGVQSIISILDKVSHLSVDRNQLLRFIHCCAACEAQQEAASGLLRTLQHSLDVSCSSCVELPQEDQTEPLRLTAEDCRAVSTVLRHSSHNTQLDLRDCEVEDSGLDLLFSVLDRVHLRVSKTVLLQLVWLVPVSSERDTVRRAVSLCRALGGELDLSHTTLDQRAHGALVQMLDVSEELTELDLSHCQLTDQLLLPLITHMHKVQVLDLSHNEITDVSTDELLKLVSAHSSINTVRLFNNKIVERGRLKKDQRFEIW